MFVYSCDINPKDVEFSVGFDTISYQYVIHVIDFGMVTKLKDGDSLDHIIQNLSEEPYVSFIKTSTDMNNTVDVF